MLVEAGFEVGWVLAMALEVGLPGSRGEKPGQVVLDALPKIDEGAIHEAGTSGRKRIGILCKPSGDGEKQFLTQVCPFLGIGVQIYGIFLQMRAERIYWFGASS